MRLFALHGSPNNGHFDTHDPVPGGVQGGVLSDSTKGDFSDPTASAGAHQILPLHAISGQQWTYRESVIST